MTVRTLEEEPPRTVRLPGWYLDAAVRPGQSRRVDLAYARTDMRSQGRTEQRALLALDGAEDMQGGYVQLTRSKQRTDLYLTVGPEPLGPDEERPHPAWEVRAPEELLARVLTRDGSKTLATDTPDVLDVRRLSTAELRAERDRLAQLRAQCPPDRSRELQLATRRAGRGRAGSPAGPRRPPGRRRAGCRPGRELAARRELAAARERLVLAEHALRDHQRAGRPGRRAARHPAPGAAAASGLDGSPRRRPAGPGAGGGAGGCLAAAGRPARPGPGPAGLVAGRTRPRPHRPPGAERCGAWPPRNWTATGAPTAWTTPGRRSMVGAGWPGTGGRLHWPRPPPMPNGPTGQASSGAPRPRRAHPPRRPRAASDRGGRPAAPGRPGPAAGRRAPPAGAGPPARLAGRPGRAGAPGRLGPPPRPPRPAASRPRPTRPHPRPRPRPAGTR